MKLKFLFYNKIRMADNQQTQSAPVNAIPFSFSNSSSQQNKIINLLFLGDFYKNNFLTLLCDNVESTNYNNHYICYVPKKTNDYHLSHIFHTNQQNHDYENLLEKSNVIFISFYKLLAMIENMNTINVSNVIHLFVNNLFAIEELQKIITANVSNINIFVYSNQCDIIALNWTCLFIF
ncbi:MAG: hypothetical protein EBS86_15565, partial [Crocinitomicaceae bacterium]|nr:hypothetical protein [Crocinitomicaceae bacterium]